VKLVALLALVLVLPAANADEPLWNLLERGGQVLFLRHALTTPGVGDPPEFRLADCNTQRNLSEEGRIQARQIGEALQRRKVTAQEVLASPWCRCIETARLALGGSRIWEPLSNLFGRQEAAADQVKALRARIGAWRGNGNLVLVSHGSTAFALTGAQPAMGEMLVLTPVGPDAFKLAGRLAVTDAPSPPR
jgi:broad specificity phosphatase PhoE